jgi:hypothetical protein
LDRYFFKIRRKQFPNFRYIEPMYAELLKLEEQCESSGPNREPGQQAPAAYLQAAKAWSAEIWRLSRQLGPLPLSEQQINDGLNLAMRPVFVCGVQRSGTTLVQNLLDAHPELSVLPSEGTFLTNIAGHLQRRPVEKHEEFLATEWLKRLANPTNQPPYWLLGRSTFAGSAYVDFVRAFIAWYGIIKKAIDPRITMWPHLAVILAYATSINRLNAAYWVDKTPVNEKYIPQIWRQFPSAKVIQAIRNPTDVLLSRKKMEPGLILHACLNDLKISYQTALALSATEKERFMLVRYEELCADEDGIVAQITQFLGIQQLPILFTPTVAGKPTKANSSFNADAPAGKIIKTGLNEGDKQLTVADKMLLSAYLYLPATRLGYSLNPVSYMKNKWVKLKQRFGSKLNSIFS